MGRAETRRSEREMRRASKQNKQTQTHPDWFDRPAEVYREFLSRNAHYETFLTAGGLEVIDALVPGLKADRLLGNVLEIGHGKFPVSHRFRPGKLTMLDILEEHIAPARNFIETENKHALISPSRAKSVNFVTGDARQGIPTEFAGQHFSLITLPEILTHVRPEERLSFLQEWGKVTDSFLIIDRQLTEKQTKKTFPEFIDSRSIASELKALGFQVTSKVHYINKGGRSQPFIVMIAKKY